MKSNAHFYDIKLHAPKTPSLRMEAKDANFVAIDTFFIYSYGGKIKSCFSKSQLWVTAELA